MLSLASPLSFKKTEREQKPDSPGYPLSSGISSQNRCKEKPVYPWCCRLELHPLLSQAVCHHRAGVVTYSPSRPRAVTCTYGCRLHSQVCCLVWRTRHPANYHPKKAQVENPEISVACQELVLAGGGCELAANGLCLWSRRLTCCLTSCALLVSPSDQKAGERFEWTPAIKMHYRQEAVRGTGWISHLTLCWATVTFLTPPHHYYHTHTATIPMSTKTFDPGCFTLFHFKSMSKYKDSY